MSPWALVPTLPRALLLGDSRRARVILALAVFALSFVLRGTHLGQPPSYFFDEVYYVYTAQLLARGDPAGWGWWRENPEGFAIEWTHPPLAKLAIAQSIRWFGDRAWVWRLPGALAVSLASVVMFSLGIVVFRSTLWGLVAAGLFTFDLLPLAQAKIATPEAFLYLFTLLVFLAAVAFVRSPRLLRLVALGVGGGLLLATKWNGIVALGLAALLAAAAIIRAVRRGRWRVGAALLAGGGCLALMPIVVYLLLYVPFFTSGHDVATFKGLHQQMYWYHSRLQATHPYQSQFWQWPLVFRSVWYYTHTDPTTGSAANIYALGNPAIWWGGAAAMVWLLVKAVRSRGQNHLTVILVAAYLFLWLPYALSPRVMFLYHYLPASVVMMLGLVFALRAMRQTRIGRLGVAGYLALVVVAFVVLFPIVSGTYITPAHRDALLWLPGWR